MTAGHAIDTTMNESFITLYIEGYSVDGLGSDSNGDGTITAEECALVPDALARKKYFDGQYWTDYNGNPARNNPETVLKAKGYTNVFQYKLLEGTDHRWGKPAYPTSVQGKIDEITDIYMLEIGDFNTGSALLGGGYEIFKEARKTAASLGIKMEITTFQAQATPLPLPPIPNAPAPNTTLTYKVNNLNAEYSQPCFIALAKCEWVYR